MKPEEIKSIIDLHQLWLNNKKGKKADLQGANLRGADLYEADLRGANLQGANLYEADLQCANLQCANLKGANLREANLYEADLQCANLQCANLKGANLREANLKGANFQGANLREADLRGVNLDFSSGISFSCKGTNFIGDDRLFYQMINHLTRVDWSNCSDEIKEFLEQIQNKKEIINGFCNYRNDVERI